VDNVPSSPSPSFLCPSWNLSPSLFHASFFPCFFLSFRFFVFESPVEPLVPDIREVTEAKRGRGIIFPLGSFFSFFFFPFHPPSQCTSTGSERKRDIAMDENRGDNTDHACWRHRFLVPCGDEGKGGPWVTSLVHQSPR